MDGTVNGEPKKDAVAKDGSTTWDSEACGLVYRGDCCFSSCTYTSDHYHCQVCGISTSDVSQALAHIRASPACRKDSVVHYSAPSVGMVTDPTNSLYNAIYSNFTAQNTYPTPSFSGYSQMDSFQWHPTIPDKVAICSNQLSPCCSSNGGTYIPVESQLCSPISDLYSKVTAPIRDLVSLPAKSAGSTIDSQAWFAAYNTQPIQKSSFKYSDQNVPPQINFILLDPADQKNSEPSQPTSSASTSFNPKSDKDVLKDTFCNFSQSLPGMLSEDAIFSLQLQDETLKQTDIHQTSVPQMLLSDLNISNKSGSQADHITNTSRDETHYTHEHFNNYISSCGAYPAQDQGNNEEGEASNQPSSAASDSDESDIIVEDTGDDLGSHMTESEIFIEDIKCSLLQGVVSDEENHTSSINVYRGKGGKNVGCMRKEIKNCRSSEHSKIQSNSQVKTCLPSYNSLLKCVICEKSVADGIPGSVLVEMNNQMPLTTSSQTPVLTKLNEVVAVEVTDFLDVNGKFMCQSCFNLVDTVDSIESKLVSLKQDIAAMIKSGSKPSISLPYSKLPVALMDKTRTSMMNTSSGVKNDSPDSICVQELFGNSLGQEPPTGKPHIAGEQTNGQATTNRMERKEYMLLSGRALSLASSIDKVSLSLGQHCPTAPVHEEGTPTVNHHRDPQSLSDVHCIPSNSCQIPPIQSTLKEDVRKDVEGGLYQSPGLQQKYASSSERSKTDDVCFTSTEMKNNFFETSSNLKGMESTEDLTLQSILPQIQPLRKHGSHDAKHSLDKCHEILELEPKRPETISAEHFTEQFTCSVCSETFPSNNLLETHLSSYSKTDAALCELCGKLHHCSKHLDEHMSQTHSVYQKHCESCGMGFFHPCLYEVHLQTPCEAALQNSSLKTLPHLPCDKCSQTFHSQSCLENHKKEIHAPKKVLSKCDLCDRTFVKPSDLQAHKRSHSDTKNFECKICGRRYKSLGNLNHHAKSHEQKKPFSCEICSQGFLRKDFYETHINSHKDSKPYKCDRCQKGFLSKSYLQTHLKWHDDKIKKVTCPICKKTFSQRLNVHMRSHTGERPHACLQCPKKFITASAMRKHMKRIHSQASNAENEQCPSDSSVPALSDSDEACSPLSRVQISQFDS